MVELPPQLENEPIKAYQAFLVYCGMGAGRNYEKIREDTNKSLHTVRKYSELYSWNDRVAEYDRRVAMDLAREDAERHLSELQKHRDRSLALTDAMYKSSARMLQKLQGIIEELPSTPASVNAIANFIRATTELSAHSLQVKELYNALDKTDNPTDI